MTSPITSVLARASRRTASTRSIGKPEGGVMLIIPHALATAGPNFQAKRADQALINPIRSASRTTPVSAPPITAPVSMPIRLERRTGAVMGGALTGVVLEAD